MFTLEPKTFMGERRRNWNSNDLCVDLSHYEAGCLFPRHGHRDVFSCFVLNGACEEQAGGHREILRPGSLIYHPPGFDHSNRWHAEGRCMHVEFASGFLCPAVKRNPTGKENPFSRLYTGYQTG